MAHRTLERGDKKLPSRFDEVNNGKSKYSHKMYLILVGLDRRQPAYPTRFRLVGEYAQQCAPIRKLKAQVTPLAKTSQCRMINNTRWIRHSAITNNINGVEVRMSK